MKSPFRECILYLLRLSLSDMTFVCDSVYMCTSKCLTCDGHVSDSLLIDRGHEDDGLSHHPCWQRLAQREEQFHFLELNVFYIKGPTADNLTPAWLHYSGCLFLSVESL